MRSAAVLAVVACGSAAPVPVVHEPRELRAEHAAPTRVEQQVRVVVLGLEVIGGIDDATIAVARSMTSELRSGLDAYGWISGERKWIELIDELVVNGCSTPPDAICLSTIAHRRQAALLVYGFVDERSGSYDFTIATFDAATQQERRWQGSIPNTETSVREAAGAALASLFERR